jgi:hypothetical protein
MKLWAVAVPLVPDMPFLYCFVDLVQLLKSDWSQTGVNRKYYRIEASVLVPGDTMYVCNAYPSSPLLTVSISIAQILPRPQVPQGCHAGELYMCWGTLLLWEYHVRNGGFPCHIPPLRTVHYKHSPHQFPLPPTAHGSPLL